MASQQLWRETAAHWGSRSSLADGAGGGFAPVAGFGGGFFAGGLLGGVVAAGAGFVLCGGLLTARSFRILSSLFGPIPLVARRSSVLRNDPYDFRTFRILSAVEGPMPGTCCNSAELAVFRLTNAAAVSSLHQDPASFRAPTLARGSSCKLL